MSEDGLESARQDLADQRQTQDDEVLEREGFEKELMEDDASEAGGDVDGIQEGDTS